jgi:hypothetical protein
MAAGPTARGMSGWVLFAATVLVIVGVFDVIMGLAALFSDDVFVVSEDGLLVFDYTAWGVIHLVWGIVMVVVGFGLTAASETARWVAILVVGLNTIAQVAFIVAFPLWTILLIALDVLVIYGLAARWEDDGRAAF